ncbi:hypothetical protein DL93DRAFT_2164833 [Clavulina sp. PMI_390]|nr:hypothetical protein DL93DRAFT_2164833 [Clavulina sp. PMI_390]
MAAPARTWDAEKVRKVLEGRAVMRVVDVDPFTNSGIGTTIDPGCDDERERRAGGEDARAGAGKVEPVFARIVDILSFPFSSCYNAFLFDLSLDMTDPNNTRSILQISQISRILREIVLDTSEFFTHADWNNWHPQLIRTWNTRSKQRPLAIALNHDAYSRLYDSTILPAVPRMEQDNALQQEFENVVGRCTSLSLTFKNLSDSILQPGGLPLQIFGARCPKLVHLSITCHGGETVYMDLGSFPTTIKNMHLVAVQPSFAREMQLEALTCGFHDIDAYIGLLPLLPKLESLTLHQFHGEDLFYASDTVRMEALKRLEIRQIRPDETIAVAVLLQHHLELPSVEQVALSGMVISEADEEIFWHALATATPSVQCITLKREETGYWPLNISLRSLFRLDKFPLLSELRLLGRDVGHLVQPMLEVARLRTSVTNLTLPPRNEFGGPALRAWDSIHQLARRFTVSPVPPVLPLYGGGAQTLPPHNPIDYRALFVHTSTCHGLKVSVD